MSQNAKVEDTQVEDKQVEQVEPEEEDCSSEDEGDDEPDSRIVVQQTKYTDGVKPRMQQQDQRGRQQNQRGRQYDQIRGQPPRNPQYHGHQSYGHVMYVPPPCLCCVPHNYVRQPHQMPRRPQNPDIRHRRSKSSVPSQQPIENKQTSVPRPNPPQNGDINECKFGEGCTNTSEKHLQTFSHPNERRTIQCSKCPGNRFTIVSIVYPGGVVTKRMSKCDSCHGLECQMRQHRKHNV